MRSTAGIQAQIGEELRDRAGVRYQELGTKSILNRVDTPRMPDCWTINPYRGCSFGCRYCYARYTHGFLGIDDPLAFERQIFVKLGAGDVLQREATARKLRARPIALGTATDPYQPAESKYRLTAEILEVLSRFSGLHLSITTKSALVLRDLEILQRICARSTLSINVSLITLDRALARDLDPGAPTPERRLRTVQSLSEAGIPVGVNAMPVLPEINDGDDELRDLFLAARDSGAGWVTTAPLFLSSTSRTHFLDWLRRRRPEKLPLYRRLYAQGIDADASWRQELRARIERIRKDAGVPSCPPQGWRRRERDSVQLALPGLAASAGQSLVSERANARELGSPAGTLRTDPDTP